MAIAHVASVTAGLPTGGTTSAIDTTGANFLIAAVSWNPSVGSITGVSDSRGNTWTALTVHQHILEHKFWYAKNATVGTGHTFTLSVSGTVTAAFMIHAFSGVDTTSPFVAENGAYVGSDTSLATGSVTATTNGSLIFAGLASAVTSASISDSMILTTKYLVGGTNYTGATGYLIQSTAAAINPVWTISPAGTMTVSIAVFKPAASGGGSTGIVNVLAKASAGAVTEFAANAIVALPCTTVIMYTPDTSAYERSLDPNFGTTVPVTFDSNSQAIISGGYIKNKSASASKAVFKKSRKK